MKAVILAGGLGTRLSEETGSRPKPMVHVGGCPILWHIMKTYSHYDVNEFVVCCGYKGYVIKEYFANYFTHMSDVTFDLKTNGVEIHHERSEPWKVTLVDTGSSTMTGGRLKRVTEHLDDETFFMTYGDGVADVDIHKTLQFHRSHGKLATLTATQPPGRFGRLDIRDGGHVQSFVEKPVQDSDWINGGFFVLEPKVIDYIEDDQTVWERKPLEHLAQAGQLRAYRHEGFWQPMDTLRDKLELDRLWTTGQAPWKVWP